ncbi:MAG: hypothetical protein JWO31_1490, partial [Phycisphaerales bacterium]|nr:hypothetical protein [Phycisphaerales bacterium]
MALPSRRNLFARTFARTGQSRAAVTARRAPARALIDAAAAVSSVAERLEDRRLMAAQPTVQLINAATDKVISTMTDGMTVDLGKVGADLN